jgi:hypothetical protein
VQIRAGLFTVDVVIIGARPSCRGAPPLNPS